MELSEALIDKIHKTVKKLADETKNAQAITLNYNLNISRNLQEKRKWITLFYANCFQLLSFMDMAVKTKVSDSEFMLELDELFTQTKS
jgi:hypothetical protein